MNLVVGASGMLGTEICRKLAEEGKQVRALVRGSTDPAKRDKLKTVGANLAYGDLKDPSTLETACLGVSAVISTASSTFSRQAGDTIETVDLTYKGSSIWFARRGRLEFISSSSSHSRPHPRTLLYKGSSEPWSGNWPRAGLCIPLCNPPFSLKYG